MPLDTGCQREQCVTDHMTHFHTQIISPREQGGAAEKKEEKVQFNLRLHAGTKARNNTV